MGARNIILRKGRGKTSRMIVLSEFYYAPIICANESQRRNIENIARRTGCKIPMPITVPDLLNGKINGHTYDKFLIDESQDVLVMLVSALTGSGEKSIIGMTTTMED